MKLDENNRKVLIYVSLAAIAIITVIIIILIWFPSNNKKNIVRYGIPKDINDSSAQEYSRVIRSLLDVNNSDELFKVLDPVFLNEYKLDKDSFKNYLQSNFMIGNNPVIISWEIQKQEDDVYVYIFKYRINGFYRYVNLIETFPYEYTLSFEQNKIPSSSTNTVVADTVINDISFYITIMERTRENIKYKIEIKNESDKNITFNFNDLDTVTLQTSDGVQIRLNSVIMTDEDKNFELTPNSYVKKEYMYPADMGTQSKIVGMLFKDIKIGDESKNIAIEF